MTVTEKKKSGNALFNTLQEWVIWSSWEGDWVVDFEKTPGNILLPKIHADKHCKDVTFSKPKGMLDSAKYTYMPEEKIPNA